MNNKPETVPAPSPSDLRVYFTGPSAAECFPPSADLDESFAHLGVSCLSAWEDDAD